VAKFAQTFLEPNDRRNIYTPIERKNQQQKRRLSLLGDISGERH
jgi:hypothetical protein